MESDCSPWPGRHRVLLPGLRRVPSPARHRMSFHPSEHREGRYRSSEVALRTEVERKIAEVDLFAVEITPHRGDGRDDQWRRCTRRCTGQSMQHSAFGGRGIRGRQLKTGNAHAVPCDRAGAARGVENDIVMLDPLQRLTPPMIAPESRLLRRPWKLPGVQGDHSLTSSCRSM